MSSKLFIWYVYSSVAVISNERTQRRRNGVACRYVTNEAAAKQATIESNAERVNPGLFPFARQLTVVSWKRQSKIAFKWIQIHFWAHSKCFTRNETCRRHFFYKITFSIFPAFLSQVLSKVSSTRPKNLRVRLLRLPVTLTIGTLWEFTELPLCKEIYDNLPMQREALHVLSAYYYIIESCNILFIWMQRSSNSRVGRQLMFKHTT